MLILYTYNDKKTRQYSTVMLKAFDKVNHYGLFLKLIKRFIPVELLVIFENWLPSCSACVKWQEIYRVRPKNVPRQKLRFLKSRSVNLHEIFTHCNERICTYLDNMWSYLGTANWTHKCNISTQPCDESRNGYEQTRKALHAINHIARN